MASGCDWVYLSVKATVTCGCWTGGQAGQSTAARIQTILPRCMLASMELLSHHRHSDLVQAQRAASPHGPGEGLYVNT